MTQPEDQDDGQAAPLRRSHDHFDQEDQEVSNGRSLRDIKRDPALHHRLQQSKQYALAAGKTDTSPHRGEEGKGTRNQLLHPGPGGIWRREGSLNDIVNSPAALKVMSSLRKRQYEEKRKNNRDVDSAEDDVEKDILTADVQGSGDDHVLDSSSQLEAVSSQKDEGKPATEKKQKVLNVAFYKFIDFSHFNLQDLKQELVDMCEANRIKGTILIANEGINLFVAGYPLEIQNLIDHVRALLARAKAKREAYFQELNEEIDRNSDDKNSNVVQRLSSSSSVPYHSLPAIPSLNTDDEFKQSWSSSQPYRHMSVKIKKEIITFGVQHGIAPEEYTSRRISPRQLKEWLDKGKKISLLDTRNNFEWETGSFKGAIPINIDKFRDFPEAVDKLPDLEEIKESPVVTFCTGGIRCEKAAAYLERHHGFKEVYQLDGGILKYFSDCTASKTQIKKRSKNQRNSIINRLAGNKDPVDDGGNDAARTKGDERKNSAEVEKGNSDDSTTNENNKETHYEGSCFVFDHRVAVDTDLNVVPTKLCKLCLWGREDPAFYPDTDGQAEQLCYNHAKQAGTYQGKLENFYPGSKVNDETSLDRPPPPPVAAATTTTSTRDGSDSDNDKRVYSSSQCPTKGNSHDVGEATEEDRSYDGLVNQYDVSDHSHGSDHRTTTTTLFDAVSRRKSSVFIERHRRRQYSLQSTTSHLRSAPHGAILPASLGGGSASLFMPSTLLFGVFALLSSAGVVTMLLASSDANSKKKANGRRRRRIRLPTSA